MYTLQLCIKLGGESHGIKSNKGMEDMIKTAPSVGRSDGSNLGEGKTTNLYDNINALKGALQSPKKTNFQQHSSH